MLVSLASKQLVQEDYALVTLQHTLHVSQSITHLRLWMFKWPMSIINNDRNKVEERLRVGLCMTEL